MATFATTITGTIADGATEYWVVETSGNDAIRVDLSADGQPYTVDILVSGAHPQQGNFDPNDYDSVLPDGPEQFTDTGDHVVGTDTVDRSVALAITNNSGGQITVDGDIDTHSQSDVSSVARFMSQGAPNQAGTVYRDGQSAGRTIPGRVGGASPAEGKQVLASPVSEGYRLPPFTADYLLGTPAKSYNTLAINNTPVGGSLSGVYRFSSTFGMFNTVYNTVSANTTIPSQDNTTFALSPVSVGEKPARFSLQMEVDPSTGTLSTMYIDVWHSNLSSGIYSYRGTSSNSPAGEFQTGGMSVTGGQTKTLGMLAPPKPNFGYRYVKNDYGPRYTTTEGGGVPVEPFLGTTSTTFTPNIYFIGQGGFSTLKVRAEMFVYEFAQPTPTETLTSSL